MALFLKNLLFSVLVPGTVAGWLPWLLGRDGWPPPWWAAALAAPLFAAGLALYLWCVWDFASFGRATPAPIDAPKRLVIRGAYRFVRNPMYLAVLALILGWAVLLRSPAVLLHAAVMATAFHLFVTLYEEPHLRRSFGDEHAEHCRRVPRWLPSLRGGRSAPADRAG